MLPTILDSGVLVFLCKPLPRVMTYSGKVYGSAVYEVPEPPVPLDRLVQVLDLYLFKDFLHEVLDIEDEFTLPVVLHLGVRVVQEEWDFPSLRPGIS